MHIIVDSSLRNFILIMNELIKIENIKNVDGSVSNTRMYFFKRIMLFSYWDFFYGLKFEMKNSSFLLIVLQLIKNIKYYN